MARFIKPKVDYENEEENEWVQYIHRYFGHETEDGSHFPDSEWNYHGPHSIFEQANNFLKKGDEEVKKMALDVLYECPDVDASGIEVFVNRGVVDLVGGVRSMDEKLMAGKVLRNLPGVWGIQNRLVVEEIFRGGLLH